MRGPATATPQQQAAAVRAAYDQAVTGQCHLDDALDGPLDMVAAPIGKDGQLVAKTFDVWCEVRA